ncbi:hypothetical protein ACX27_07840 [Nostoc piscinale CENA21]|uniref:Uncharacterized protein n=1 Tax=Nostoc piscinale CENA21 TaxID=224013 RepID=A0A0M4SQC4_9NOSO|nr:hypothetical protein [Nostoc piscinale]ALF52790.1 hypothetical protein ACX27_07840 [Nostoc piscinale CENA21]
MSNLVLSGEIAEWEFLDEIDTPKSFEAFCTYRDLGVGRSLKRTADILGKRIELISRWSKNGRWTERINAYDRETERIKREVSEREEIIAHKNKLRKYRETIEDLGWMQLQVAADAVYLVSKALVKYKNEDKELKPLEVRALAAAGVSASEIGAKLLNDGLAVTELLNSIDSLSEPEPGDYIDITSTNV